MPAKEAASSGVRPTGDSNDMFNMCFSATSVQSGRGVK